MNYAQQQRNPVRQMAILAVVLVFQALLIWALVSGLGHSIVDMVKPPIETKIIEEHKQPPPPPPPPPPPTLAQPPPPYIPPPDIQIQQPPPPKAIQTVTRTPPPTPPAPGPIATHPAPPGPAVADHDVGERPLNGGSPDYPEEMQDQGREGSVNVTCDVDTTGKTHNCQVTSTQGGSSFARSAMDFVSTRRYAPRVHNGVPVESRHTFHITYRLGSE